MKKIKVFQFQGGKKAKKLDKAATTAYETKDPAQVEEPGLIQGQPSGSLQEWWVSLALERLGLDYQYQYSIKGGRSISGGQVIDFLVDTIPLPTPLQVQGDYWHGGIKSAKTSFNVEQVNKYFKGRAQPVVELWGHETLDKTMTFNAVRSNLLNA